MKKYRTSKAKLVRTYLTIELDHVDIITWLRGRTDIPNDAKNVCVTFNVLHDDVVFPVVENGINVCVDRPITVTWMVEKVDDTDRR